MFIFPDLNTGNTTYKAVQRSADTVSIGPMLQGMRKPVNDLSRGALVDDIVYTVALTAIQSSGLTLPPRRNSSPNETRGIAVLAIHSSLLSLYYSALAITCKIWPSLIFSEKLRCQKRLESAS